MLFTRDTILIFGSCMIWSNFWNLTFYSRICIDYWLHSSASLGKKADKKDFFWYLWTSKDQNFVLWIIFGNFNANWLPKKAFSTSYNVHHRPCVEQGWYWPASQILARLTAKLSIVPPSNVFIGVCLSTVLTQTHIELKITHCNCSGCRNCNYKLCYVSGGTTDALCATFSCS